MKPLVLRVPDREGGSEVGCPESGYRFGCARRGFGPLARIGADFSAKEKDEASLPDRFRESSWNAFILRFAGV
jgi:hypothetical protein